MSKHPNRESDRFDNIIRRKLQEHPAEFDPAAWEAMEKKLDQPTGAKGGMSGMGGRIAGFLGILLILFLAGWWFFGNDGKEETAVIAQEQQEALESVPANSEGISGNSQPVNFSGADEAADGLDQEGLSDKSGQRTEQEMSHNPDAEFVDYDNEKAVNKGTQDFAAEEPGNKGVITNKADSYLAGKGSPAYSVKENAETVMEQQPKESGSFSGTSETEIVNSLNSSKIQITPASEAGEPDLKKGSSGRVTESDKGAVNKSYKLYGDYPESIKIARWLVGNGRGPFFSINKPVVLSAAPKVEIAELNAPEEENPEVVVKQKKGIPLSVMLGVAPDFTGTSQKGSTKAGAGVGLFLEYEFIPGLSLVSGAFYSRKNYLTDNAFSPYGEFWDYRPSPDYIDASCGVIDIPVNLRFYVMNSKRHRIFVSAGASAYLMKSENYTMVYKDYSYDDYTYSVSNENKHLPAIYNFSVGYQVNFSSRWGLQAEPFYKLPAKGVGIGAVKLNSMGAFVNLRYSLGR